MYNCILLSDNEKELSDMLAFFAKKREQIEVVYSSDSNEDSEELCLLYHPDMVVLDLDKEYNEIVEMINRVEGISPAVRIIVFTSYTQFSFSSAICRLENVFFLPRPVTLEALAVYVEQIVHDLDAIRESMFSPAALSTLLNDYVPIIRQHYLSMILRRPMPKTEDILQKFDTLKIDCPGPNYVVIVTDILSDEYIEDFEALSFLLRTSIKTEITAKGFQCYIFFDSEFKINCLVGSKNSEIEAALESVLVDVKSRFEKMVALRFAAGIGKMVHSASDIYLSFKSAEMALTIARKEGSIALYHNIQQSYADSLTQEQVIDDAMKCFETGNVKSCEDILQQYLCIYDEVRDTEKIKSFVIRFALKGIMELQQKETVALDYLAFTAMFSRLCAATDYENLWLCTKEFLRLFFQKKQDENIQGDNLIERAMEYIHSHLHEPALDLELVGGEIGISKYYLCRRFHQVTKQNFNTYIRIQRVEKAKQLLLHSQLKNYEIAECTGFSSTKYFSLVFKQITGMTPSEFQRCAAETDY